MGFGYFPFIQPSGVNPLIYDANGHLILQLGYVAGVSSIKGQVATGCDLNGYANSTDAYPYWRLHGDGEIEFYQAVGSYTKLLDGNVQALKIEYGSNVTTIQGGGLAGDDLRFRANSTDTYPKIDMLGGSNFSFSSTTGVIFNFAGTDYGYVGITGGDFTFNSYADKNISFVPNGAGKVKFGAYTAGAATDSTGYITILDAAGNTRKLMVQA